MDWQSYLRQDEEILWQGRPAPRCYTFRNWKLALIGLFLFLASSFWLMLGLQLVSDGHSPLLSLIPVPLVVASFLMGPGQLLAARIGWERLFYCLTDERVLIQHGLLKGKVREVPREEIDAWKRKRHGEQLASIRLQHRTGKGHIILHCLEQPQFLLDHLEKKTP